MGGGRLGPLLDHDLLMRRRLQVAALLAEQDGQTLPGVEALGIGGDRGLEVIDRLFAATHRRQLDRELHLDLDEIRTQSCHPIELRQGLLGTIELLEDTGTHQGGAGVARVESRRLGEPALRLLVATESGQGGAELGMELSEVRRVLEALLEEVGDPGVVALLL